MRMLLLSVCAIAIGAAVVHAENWPSWRGPENNGVSKETKLPTTWSGTKNVVWKMPLPSMAGATPVVWGDRIFLSGAEGYDCMLSCASTEGKQLWKRKVATATRLTIKQGEANETS